MIHKTIFTVLIDIEKDSVPIFIPTFNQSSLLKLTLDQVSESGRRIVIYDNASSFEDMIDLLHDCAKDFDVVMSNKNMGPRLFTEDQQILKLMPNYFIVTDPDLIYNQCLPENHIDEMKDISKRLNLAKVGMALEIFDDGEQSKFVNVERVLGWERGYWENEIGITSTKDPVYEAWIDTTYALNDRELCLRHRKFGKPTFRYPAARIGGKYTCSHIGWWRKELMPQNMNEIEFYLKNQQWSHTENHYYRGLES